MPARSRPRPTTPGLPPFDRLIERHGPALLRFCQLKAGHDRAEDCVQETLLAALGSYDEVRDAGAVRGWLFAIAARKVVDSHRARARAPQPVEDIAAIAVAAEPSPRNRTLWIRVTRLPEKQRQAVTLRYAADLSHREIAAVMQTTEAAARRNVFEGLNRLRKELAETP